ncbi:hypothetical protein GGQ73_002145 [Rhizobium skierniewicense]|uniref:Uncharacterized protein n=1 Tax=Rhizobium skierniewicense TaxID=984260 RepID=A0A7W6CB25_9HYPH|nr:hypothetical protein [Rhizobium skierniewicense]
MAQNRRKAQLSYVPIRHGLRPYYAACVKKITAVAPLLAFCADKKKARCYTGPKFLQIDNRT